MSYNPTSSESIHYTDENSFLINEKKTCSTLRRFRPVIFCILLFELCERLTFYSITANFVRFCTIYLQVDNITGLNLSLIFTGFIYIISLFCGWISDSVLGKFKTIVLSGIIYIMGVALITIVTIPYQKYFTGLDLTVTDKRVFTGFGLVLIAFGTGGIKTTVGPFGAEQFKEKSEKLTRLFFIWYYWFVNLGSGIAFVVVTYVQQNIDFFYGFLIPMSSIFVAMLIFVIPQKFYTTKFDTHSESSIFTFFGIFFEALSKRSKSIYRYSSFLDYAKLSTGGSYEDSLIDDLRKMLRILPVLLTFIPFYISYVQMQSTFLLQAERLYLNVSSFVIPIASLNVVNTIVILFVIPILAVLVYPIVTMCFKTPPSHLKRIGIGLVLSALSVITAGILEIARKQDLYKTGGVEQTVFDKTYNVSKISVLTQIPQFFFVGVGEVFASATGLEFAYSQAPVTMQGIITGLLYVMIGIGSFSSSLLILIVNANPTKKWVPDNIDDGHYENFFFLLGGIILLDVVIFIFIARNYKYSNQDEKKRLIITYESKPDRNADIIFS